MMACIQENFHIAITSITSPEVVRNGTTQMALKFFCCNGISRSSP